MSVSLMDTKIKMISAKSDTNSDVKAAKIFTQPRIIFRSVSLSRRLSRRGYRW